MRWSWQCDDSVEARLPDRVVSEADVQRTSAQVAKSSRDAADPLQRSTRGTRKRRPDARSAEGAEWPGYRRDDLMDRRDFIGAIAANLLASPVALRAQQPRSLPRVGLLIPGLSPSRPNSNLAAFEQGLRELGWSDGRNLVMERRYAAGTGASYR